MGFPNIEYYSVGKLDFKSEGLMLLTNDRDTAIALDEGAAGMKREYKIRAYGEITDEKIEAIRKGAFKRQKQHDPMYIWVNEKSSKNN